MLGLKFAPHRLTPSLATFSSRHTEYQADSYDRHDETTLRLSCADQRFRRILRTWRSAPVLRVEFLVFVECHRTEAVGCIAWLGIWCDFLLARSLGRVMVGNQPPAPLLLYPDPSKASVARDSLAFVLPIHY
jgi:hypothetical protein